MWKINIILYYILNTDIACFIVLYFTDVAFLNTEAKTSTSKTITHTLLWYSLYCNDLELNLQDHGDMSVQLFIIIGKEGKRLQEFSVPLCSKSSRVISTLSVNSAYEQVQQCLVLAQFKTIKMSLSVLSFEFFYIAYLYVLLLYLKQTEVSLWINIHIFSKDGIHFSYSKLKEYTGTSSASLTSVKFKKALYLFIVGLWGYRVNFKKHKTHILDGFDF